MFLKSLIAAGMVLTASFAPAFAEDHPMTLHVHDVYARVTGGIGKTGAAFFKIHNGTATDDRLIAAASDVAKRTELHTHMEAGDGVMKMMPIEGGIAIPAGEDHLLQRGGDHVMLMGLTRELKDGDSFALTLTFEQAGSIQVDVTVDNQREAEAAPMGHGHMKHGG